MAFVTLKMFQGILESFTIVLKCIAYAYNITFEGFEQWFSKI